MASINLSPGELEAVLAVAATGSFREAAQTLNLAQPSVSSRIRRAETVLGVKLFHRTTRKVVITENGERLRRIAERALFELQSVVQEFQEQARLNRGKVVVGSTPTIAAGLLPEVIRAFRQRASGVDVELLDDFQGQMLDRVIAGAVDFAIVPVLQADARVRYEELMTDEILVAGPARHPVFRTANVSVADVASHPILAMSAHTALDRILASAFEAAGVPFDPAYRASETLSMLAMSRAGLGLAFISRMLVPTLNMKGLAVARLGKKGLHRKICCASAQGRAFTPAAESLLAEIRAAAHRMQKR